MQAIFTIWQREVIRYWRDKTRIISMVIQPLMFLFIFGFGLRQTLATGDFGVDFVHFMFPGIIAMSVMSVAIFSTISTVWDREFGFLKEILVSPTSRISIAVGKTLGASTIASAQGFILLILAPFIGVDIELSMIPGLIVFMLLLSFAISGIGLLIASLIQNTETFSLLMQLIIFPLFFLSGAFFPLTAIPKWMVVIAAVNPLTYGVDALRQIMLAPQTDSDALSNIVLYSITVNGLFLIIFSVVIVFAAVAAFNKKN